MISFLGAEQAWTRILIGGLLLIFVVVQRFIVARSSRTEVGVRGRGPAAPSIPA